MTIHEPFFPQPIFEVEEADPPSIPRVLIAPHRYIQGKGVWFLDDGVVFEIRKETSVNSRESRVRSRESRV